MDQQPVADDRAQEDDPGEARHRRQVAKAGQNAEQVGVDQHEINRDRPLRTDQGQQEDERPDQPGDQEGVRHAQPGSHAQLPRREQGQPDKAQFRLVLGTAGVEIVRRLAAPYA